MTSLPRGAIAKAPVDVQGDQRWMSMHQRYVSEARESEPEILWIGDSIIQRLVNSNIWERSFCQMHSLNFGISGDRTETLLWRIENGELEGLAPKVIVVLVGTNNFDDSAEDTATAIETICSTIRNKQPQAYLVVLSLLPRGHSPNPLRERNAKVNSLIADYLRGNGRAQLINIDPGFIQADGTISHHDMLDFLHLTQKGYDRAFEPVNDLLQQLLSESESEIVRTEAEGAA
eukprot:maker-scaffold126_size328755-snap-gene-1.17 protein:Tk06905 transcript:maker-scaffold126_size328755-snap-gene-1.17-mRNA-1 annotation:"platelet-activating factor acetylhydrolase ib subunit gamma"